MNSEKSPDNIDFYKNNPWYSEYFKDGKTPTVNMVKKLESEFEAELLKVEIPLPSTATDHKSAEKKKTSNV